VTFRFPRIIKRVRNQRAEKALKTVVPEDQERQQVEAAQRDPIQFAILYERNFRRVFAFVARRLPTREEAEDITSEVFHQALASLQSFRCQGTPFVGWLVGIAARLVAKRWQQLGMQPDFPSDEIDLADVDANAERQAILSELVNRLPEDQRRVLLRRFVEQFSIREIAQELGRSEGAVKQLQFRALENLRNQARSRHE
jgi:RNA polymerase sigma-70 factor (ECF subfamily)